MTLRDHEFTDLPTLTGPIRRTVALLAGHGFIVAVPEVYNQITWKFALPNSSTITPPAEGKPAKEWTSPARQPWDGRARHLPA